MLTKRYIQWLPAVILLITRVIAMDHSNQIILAPSSATAKTGDESDDLQEHPSSDTYISGDLLCNDDGCYPLLFEPSSEWQTVKPEQRLPAGLDIRVNLETGLKEAKLGDGNMVTNNNDDKEKKDSDGVVQIIEDKSNLIKKDESAIVNNYEFSEQFAAIRINLNKGEYTQVAEQLEEIMEFAHDYKHGFKIVSKEFDLLKSVALNESIPITVRELDTRVIVACIRNNPPVIEYIEQNYPNFVRDIFNNINEVKKVTDDVQLLVKRFINILTVLIESDPTYIVGAVDFETLRRVFYTIDDKALKFRILDIISTFIDRVHNEDIAPVMKRDGILFVIPTIQDWVKEFSRYVKEVDIDEDHLRKFFNTLYNLKTDFSKDIKVDTSFLNWLINQVEERKAHLADGVEPRDPEQDEFDRKLINSRHLVFGNEMADSIKNFHDEL
ncbi:similar to Saccharomyces cerevisiae YOL031C SIL1 Nucleotide exchange factor for the endoplasmic reticulum (ER) lumenal Hsp70 chaperone Kar2p [Maudiozyma saulgeensis]|uniref:Nucleotide exchange factor SIL1 n=1 Tax=Maudiozyma saulgeensis TaxID=1789683 RepID=A0A1X7R2Y0_9SACH|nr:similar to Saccharomyces cerevisiae YOL031C SIL1 Nucleotide exchange factor for the endoplasmic reticulum (ER) lumenal Hsp70 chaperone Kar2p [Kazachstania saulgeensis]